MLKLNPKKYIFIMRKTISILVITLFVTFTINAQENEKDNQKRSDFTPEQTATLKSKKMAIALDLNEKQQEQIFNLMKKQGEEKKAKMEEMRARREAGERPTEEERFKMENEKLDKMSANRKEMKKILNEDQFAKWEKIAMKRASKSDERRGMRGERMTKQKKGNLKAPRTSQNANCKK